MVPILNKRFLAAVAVGFGLMVGAPMAEAADVVRVSSKLDAEASVLGNMILESLKAHGIATENKLLLGPTKIVRTALLSGEIDIYPEYTGNAAFFSGTDTNPEWFNWDKGYRRARFFDEKNNVVWLQPGPANNTWAIALRTDVADANHLKTLEEFATWVNGGGVVKLAASAEFVDSPAALPAFEKTYGFHLKPEQLVVLAGGDTAVFEKAAAEKTSGVNAAVAYGTDGGIAALGLVSLTDVKGAQIVYAPAPVIRASVLTAHPEIKDILAPIFAGLDAATLQGLNAKVSLEGQDAKAVALAYLKAKGFVK